MIKIEPDGLLLASLTDVGRKRSGNEDSHAVWVSEDPAEFASRGALMVVADGMGGANAGEVASRLAADTVVETYRADTGADPAYALRVAVETANAKVHSQAQANTDQRGMGTTCTAVVVRGRQIWIGHVGDSRAYLVRGGEIHRLTSDHSLVAELVERGHLTEHDAKHDPRRNVVTRSVGALADVQVDAGEIEERLQDGDRLLICSDGLHGQVSDSEMAMLAGENEPEEACRALIELANERGGPDNITAIILRVPGETPAPGLREMSADDAITGSMKKPVIEARQAKAAKAAKAPKPEKAEADGAVVGGTPMLPKLLGALVVLVALVAIIAMTVFKQVRKPSDEAAAPTDSGVATESVMPDASTPTDTPTMEAPATDRASAPVAAAPSAQNPAATPVTTGGAKPTAAKPLGKPVPVPVTPPVAVEEPAAAAVKTEILVVTRPFQPALFNVDGQLHSQDVGSVLLRDLSPGSHTIHVEDSRGRGVTMTVVVGDVPSKEVVALLPGFEKVGELEIVVKGAETARIYIDGAQYPRMGPCTARGLAPGPHKVRGFNPKTRKMSEVTDAEVRAGGTTRVELDFPQ